MAHVIASFSMSLNGFVADPSDAVGPLFEEVHVQLVPVLLGEGIRFLGDLREPPLMLDDPTVIEGRCVTHLRYRVQDR